MCKKNTYVAPAFNINSLEPVQRVFNTDTDTDTDTDTEKEMASPVILAEASQ